MDSILSLEGMELRQEWKVGKLLKDGPKGSGGHFSVCYELNSATGSTAFLKVLDPRKALAEPDVARALEQLTSEFNFERDLLAICNGRRLSKIVICRGHGEIKLDDHPLPFFYMVFELAEGDVRTQLEVGTRRPFTWCYRVLHNAAVGVSQLHKNGIFHQDIKPSNVLV